MKASEWRVRKTAPDFNCDSSHLHDTSDIRYCCSNGSSIELQLQNAEMSNPVLAHSHMRCAPELKTLMTKENGVSQKWQPG